MLADGKTVSLILGRSHHVHVPPRDPVCDQLGCNEFYVDNAGSKVTTEGTFASVSAGT